MNQHERKECIRFMGLLDQYLRLSRQPQPLQFIWHAANERKTSVIQGYLLKQMGVKKGIPDYPVIWINLNKLIEIGFLEHKHYKGKKQLPLVTIEQREKLLDENQLQFRKQCLELGVKHAIPLSANESMDTLFQWGALREAV